MEEFTFGGRPAWAQVDLKTLKDNINSIIAGAPGKRVISVVMANAYGHGMLPVARAIKSCGVKDFAVAILNEALELRADDPDSSILVMGYTPGELAAPAIEQDITLTVYTLAEAQKIQAQAERLGKKAKLAVALDTGMSRIGFPFSDASVDAIRTIAGFSHIVLEELFSHFSSADDADKTFARGQLARFNKMKANLEAAGVVFNHSHMANSAAITDLPEAHFDSVRPGIIQYGYYPSDEVDRSKVKVRPVMSFYAALSLVKTIPTGTTVGYGNTWKAEADTVLGTIPVGYADGYNRLLSNKGTVLCQGRAVPIRGRVCMDQFMVDLSEVPEAAQGEVVTLLGEDGEASYWADDMARDLGTISYEIVCNISLRVPRKYIG